VRGFVKIVDIEDEPPFGRTEAAKIADMAIATRLNADSRFRHPGEIRRHHGPRATKESCRESGHVLIGPLIEASFQAAVDEIAEVSARLLRSLATNATPKNRETEATKAKVRAADRLST
jgi:hypothetical protein